MLGRKTCKINTELLGGTRKLKVKDVEIRTSELEKFHVFVEVEEPTVGLDASFTVMELSINDLASFGDSVDYDNPKLMLCAKQECVGEDGPSQADITNDDVQDSVAAVLLPPPGNDVHVTIDGGSGSSSVSGGGGGGPSRERGEGSVSSHTTGDGDSSTVSGLPEITFGGDPRKSPRTAPANLMLSKSSSLTDMRLPGIKSHMRRTTHNPDKAFKTVLGFIKASKQTNGARINEVIEKWHEMSRF